MNPKQFLLWGGIVLLLVGILGFIGILGPMETDSLFGSTWWFDNGENWAHTILGIVAIVASMSLSAEMQKTLTMAVGFLALFFGLYNFVSTTFMGANLESPMDLILHLAVAGWALWAGMQPAGKEA
ncbi:hypothetical protein HY524_00400 [Candidatus Berkelbacteria bacterium]|nr:hypothetical protein [Candidatus Berkelbacteria bacterium]